ncbi:hypothetical protein [Silvanigrella aquatica]|uniref:ATP-grasp domain-containing protein n=1 Tax=Silvanigrella aquatica TaxID=1915309 RepID=A0A1L4D3G8_9BACT|nr:hypothetical protein [Silvanigrella aquatica]APJ04756.1 hypothetical protein AXG55_12955 [Silvanigrella aquatica]
MQKKLLFIADSLKNIKPNSDSSLALAQAALENHWEVFWCEPNHVHILGSSIYVNNLSQLKSVSMSEINYDSNNKKILPLNFFSYCFVRKDPPFDENYKDLCWILSSQSEVKIVNPAENLLAFHEKALQWRALAEGFLNQENIIPTCLTNSIEVIEDYCNQNQSLIQSGIVCKPWLGHGGEDVELFKDKNTFIKYLHDKQKYQKIRQRIMVQPFLSEIYTEGDRRVLVANGEIIGDFVRLPAQGKIASNLAQGGSALIKEMTPYQKEICLKVASFLKQKNIFFAGLDVIGSRIGEINITSPTGLRTFEILTGRNIAKKAFSLLVN